MQDGRLSFYGARHLRAQGRDVVPASLLEGPGRKNWFPDCASPVAGLLRMPWATFLLFNTIGGDPQVR